MKGIKKLLLLLPGWMLIGFTISSCMAQSSQLQLNLLLETGQKLDWAQEFQVFIADQIPASILIGKIEDENTVVGIFSTSDLKNRLVLHGIVNDGHYNFHEWIDNSTRSGILELTRHQDSLSGYWYNQDRTIRLTISTENHKFPFVIRQYQRQNDLIHTLYNQTSEKLILPSIIDKETWNELYRPHQRCFPLPFNNLPSEFCRTGTLELYTYTRIDLVRLLHGLVPQIPHDEVFNSQVSAWLDEWANQIFQDTITDPGEQRWSHNQAIWFIPDYITRDLVSGILCIQFSGDRPVHSRSVIYDRLEKVFYSPDDFFRSHTTWGSDFQQTARKCIENIHKKSIDVYPEVMDRIKFHMTLNAKGILISSDYTPYFGRLKVQLGREEYQDQLQRFAPFGKLLFEQ